MSKNKKHNFGKPKKYSTLGRKVDVSVQDRNLIPKRTINA